LNKGPRHLYITIEGSAGELRDDAVTIEEPIEIWVTVPSDDGSHQEISLSISMRTPGDDKALVVGFLFSEGIINNIDDVKKITYFGPVTEPYSIQNQINVKLKSGDSINDRDFQRHFYSNSSCGVCGKASIQALEMQHNPQLTKNGFSISKEKLCTLPILLRKAQLEFEQTGGLHGIALIDGAGSILVIKEDVGRHNAMDKLLGELLISEVHKSAENMVLVSGRTSFELVQKALMADIPFIASIGAPSSAAIDLAKEYNMTLVGFLNQSSYNIYNGSHRIT